MFCHQEDRRTGDGGFHCAAAHPPPTLFRHDAAPEADNRPAQDLKQQKFTLEVEPTDLVSCRTPRAALTDPTWLPYCRRSDPPVLKQLSQISAVKEKISAEKGWDPKYQKLIYSGATDRTPPHMPRHS